MAEQGWRPVLVTREREAELVALLEKFALSEIDHIDDPSGQLYAAFDLGRGTPGQLMGPNVWGPGFRALLHGHWPGAPGTDVRQMPGTFLVDRGEIVSAFRAQHSGDYPDLKAMAAASRQASTEDDGKAF